MYLILVYKAIEKRRTTLQNLGLLRWMSVLGILLNILPNISNESNFLFIFTKSNFGLNFLFLVILGIIRTLLDVYFTLHDGFVMMLDLPHHFLSVIQHLFDVFLMSLSSHGVFLTSHKVFLALSNVF